jgi:hypothetical protein
MKHGRISYYGIRAHLKTSVGFLNVLSKFKNRVIAYKDSGHTFTDVEGSGLPCEAFRVTARSYYKWKKQLETGGGFC